MGKRKSIRGGYESKGERRNQVNGVKEMRQQRPNIEKEMNKIKAWRAGKNPWITVANNVNGPNNKPFIKVRANDLYGDPKRIHSYGIYGKGNSDV